MRVAPGIPLIVLGCFRLVNFPVAMLSASIHRITLLPCDQSAQVPVHATMPRLGVAAPYSAPRGLFHQQVFQIASECASEAMPELFHLI